MERIISAVALSALFWLMGCSFTANQDISTARGDDFIESQYGIGMVYVQGGTFSMGCVPEYSDDCLEREKPAHEVTLSDFYIGKYEVTQKKQWREIMGDDIRRKREEAGERPLFGEGDDYPMYYVNWYDSVDFCNRLSELTGRNPAYIIDKTGNDPYAVDGRWVIKSVPGANGWRLPSEAEWEYAARGGNKSQGYQYSGSHDLDEVAWHISNMEGLMGYGTRPVGTKNANELGIHDMTGNVWEWVNDYFGSAYYNSSPVQDPKGPAVGSLCVYRGGGWDYDDWGARLSERDGNLLDSRDGALGFRLAISFK